MLHNYLLREFSLKSGSSLYGSLLFIQNYPNRWSHEFQSLFLHLCQKQKLPVASGKIHKGKTQQRSNKSCPFKTSSQLKSYLITALVQWPCLVTVHFSKKIFRKTATTSCLAPQRCLLLLLVEKSEFKMKESRKEAFNFKNHLGSPIPP